MSDRTDAYWNELGIAWRAHEPEAALVASRLGPAVKRQAIMVKAAALLGLPAGVLGLGLAAWTIWAGVSGHAWNFLTRGATLGVVAVIALVGVGALRAALKGEGRSVREMLDLAILRAQRLVQAASLGCAALAVLAVGGLAGYVIRTRLSGPPRTSPVEALLALAVLALILAWTRASQVRALERYRRVAHALFAETGQDPA